MTDSGTVYVGGARIVNDSLVGDEGWNRTRVAIPLSEVRAMGVRRFNLGDTVVLLIVTGIALFYALPYILFYGGT